MSSGFYYSVDVQVLCPSASVLFTTGVGGRDTELSLCPCPHIRVLVAGTYNIDWSVFIGDYGSHVATCREQGLGICGDGICGNPTFSLLVNGHSIGGGTHSIPNAFGRISGSMALELCAEDIVSLVNSSTCPAVVGNHYPSLSHQGYPCHPYNEKGKGKDTSCNKPIRVYCDNGSNVDTATIRFTRLPVTTVC